MFSIFISIYLFQKIHNDPLNLVSDLCNYCKNSYNLCKNKLITKFSISYLIVKNKFNINFYIIHISLEYLILLNLC